ncbi:gamma subclass chorismate mutase AroQ [Tamaricihabitans halophyticus]|uniref:gamma subclass chorismate mutase AroQ n=1 Tax=Tamaricihabitans halophyticus TaxID=1262583 RepID=UPI001FB43773|nr:gamma subclass chorismate mutase AroQ [Tamaricihabitans halophyticus]
MASERLATADIVAAAKWGTGQPIEDPEREAQVLDTVRQQAVERGIEPDAAVAIFRDQIEANKLVQRYLHHGWTANPAQRPTERPDLDEIRPVIDRLNGELLNEIRATAGIRGQPSCRPRLMIALRQVSPEPDTTEPGGANEARHTGIHRAGLIRAAPSLCD